MTQPRINRRTALTVLGGTALAGTTTLGTASPLLAKAEKLGPLKPTIYRFNLGAFEVTTIQDGVRTLENLAPMFGKEPDDPALKELLADNFLPQSAKLGFTPTLVNTGAELILFDTGLGAGARPAMGLLRNQLAAAGVDPADVDVVVITHMHPDHIGGLMEDGKPAFPNARYVTGSTEYNFWSAEERMSGPTERIAKLVASNVTPLADKMSFIEPGGAVASGVEAIQAFGHTPGHMAYHLESEGRRLMITADTANHYVVALQRPDWGFSFDADKPGATAARRSVFGMVASDRIPFVGYHMPFPSVGYVTAQGDGFRYEPTSYQLDL